MYFAPLVSIITPMYRSGDTLPAALNSLLRQSEWRWESIVVDDGSPDESRAVAEGFARRDRRFTVLGQKNAGACAARNTGLPAARGRYVLFLDADDWLEPGALATMVRAAERGRCAAMVGGLRYARPDGTITEWAAGYDGAQPLFDALACSNVLSVPSCVLLRKNLLDEIGVFDATLAHCGDWDLWARVARGIGRVAIVRDCVTGYRMRMASLSRNPITLLRDAATVLSRIHSPDARVKKPLLQLAPGADAAQLPARLAGFTLYAAALADMQGNSAAADVALDSLRVWPELSPQRVAEFLIHAACFSRCVAPDHLRPVPPEIRRSIERISGELARRSGMENLPARITEELEALGFGRDHSEMRIADRQRLSRPGGADETHALAYLRSLALRESVA